MPKLIFHLNLYSLFLYEELWMHKETEPKYDQLRSFKDSSKEVLQLLFYFFYLAL